LGTSSSAAGGQQRTRYQELPVAAAEKRVTPLPATSSQITDTQATTKAKSSSLIRLESHEMLKASVEGQAAEARASKKHQPLLRDSGIPYRGDHKPRKEMRLAPIVQSHTRIDTKAHSRLSAALDSCKGSTSKDGTIIEDHLQAYILNDFRSST